MKILVACEESQAVTIEFRKLGHEAYSCDIEPCSGGHPEWHIKGDVLLFLEPPFDFWAQDCKEHSVLKWDMILAFPPCTRLTVAANKYYKPEYAKRFPDIQEERKAAIEFFMKFINADCEKIAVENPIGIMSTRYKKPSQIIQPYQFGHQERKATCLWLKGLPELKPTNLVEPVIIKHKSGRTDSKLHFETLSLPAKERAKIRSKTFTGIAKAMAEQWGKLDEEKE